MNAIVSTLLVADVLWERRRCVDWYVLFVLILLLGLCVAVWVDVAMFLNVVAKVIAG